MKKRKKPIFLVAVFILLISVVAAMNSNLLSEPKTPEEAQQQAIEQAQQEAQKNPPAKPVEKKKDPNAKPKSLVTSPQDSDEDVPGTNIKPIPAVDPKGPKIAAPINLKNVQKSPDRASTQANSGWFEKGSYASKG